MTRFLDWLDESAAGVIRIAYLLAGVIAVGAYFSDGRVPSGLERLLNAILPWVLAGALEIHTYLTARRVRRAYQDRIAATIGSDEYDKAEGQMRVNLWILAGLLAFSMYNQLQYLAQNWTPPHTPLTPPGPFAYIVRAVITPAAFMAAAFLAPIGEGMAAQVQSEAHSLAKATFKVASAQWKRRLREMEKNGQDVTGALVQLVEDPTERRVIETIYNAMHTPQHSPMMQNAPQIPQPDEPDTGDEPDEAAAARMPLRLSEARARSAQSGTIAAAIQPNVATLTAIARRPNAADRSRQERQERQKPDPVALRARRMTAARRILNEMPEITTNDLARAIAVATKHRCSSTTAHSLKKLIQNSDTQGNA